MKKIRNWLKEAPYEIKGGLLGAIISIILYLLVYFLFEIKNYFDYSIFETIAYTIIIFIFIMPNIWIGYFMENCLGEECLGSIFKIAIIPGIIEFFILGALIAWLIKRKRGKNYASSS